MMKIWIFQTGEPLHCDRDNSRPMRAMNLADFLVQRGHKVTIWSSNFYHQKKIHRYNETTDIKINKNLKIKLINSPGYKKNIGLSRLYDHLILGLRLNKELKKQREFPDIGFIGFPPIEFGFFASKWFKKNKVKFFVDIKDPWPDHLVDSFSSNIRWLVKLLFFPYYLITKSIFRNADGISAITEYFLDWSNKISNRKKNKNDFIFPLVSNTENQSEEEKKLSSAWAKKIIKNEDQLNIFFVGTIGKSFNFDPILKAAKYCNQNALKINFLISGDGELKNLIEHEANMLGNVHFTGWINKSEIKALGNLCTLSIAPYINNNTFKNTISNKMIDYLSLGLPILTSLDGNGANYLEQKNVACIYDENNYETLIKSLEELSLDPEKIIKMKEATLNVYNSEYSYERIYEKALKKIVGLKG